MFDKLLRFLKKIARNTFVHRAYCHYRTLLIWTGHSLEEVKFDTEVGEFSLKVNKYNWLYSDVAGGNHEPQLTKQMEKEVGQNPCYYDIGAHNGYTIKVMKKIGVSEKDIHAFEASKKRCIAMSKNFNNIEINNVTVSSETGEECIAIDEYLEDNQPPTIVKIDVEGAEIEVLEGMRDTLDEHKPILFVEVHPQYLDSSVTEITGLLEEFGYSVYSYDHHDTKNPVSFNPDRSPVDEEDYEEYHIKAVNKN